MFYLEYFTSFLSAFLLTYLAIPSIIKIARQKNLCDEPGWRRSHTQSTPSLGGVAIFAGVIFALGLWTPAHAFGELQPIISAFVIIFLIGLKDDISPLNPYKKLAGQIFAASILVFRSEVQLTSLHGIFGVETIPEVLGIVLSIFIILVLINAFNLIDGINGLSGSIGILVGMASGIWFSIVGEMALAIIAFSMAGALLAFLRFNITPAKIFMGDTGALLVGMISAVLAIRFIELHDEKVITAYPTFAFKAAPAMAVSMLILPLFDTLRVFISRALKGRSPLQPDRSHIHHLLIDHGFSHMQATGILISVNIFFIFVALTFQSLGPLYLILLLLLLACGLTSYLHFSVMRKNLNKSPS